MPRRVRLALLLVAVAGCQAFSSRSEPPTPPAAAARPKPGPVQRVSFETAPARDTELSPPADAISLAADCLERGDDAAAAGHLKRHVGEHPDQLVFRAQLAELLVRLDRLSEAQAHFEAAIAHGQDGPASARRELVHYHTRLMEIARVRSDAFAEHLHRGIGLYLVGRRLADKDAGTSERLLCKAAAALKEAQTACPDDARPAWYLYCVWTQLEQPRPAERALRHAIAAAPYTRLTPAEARELTLASRSELILK